MSIRRTDKGDEMKNNMTSCNINQEVWFDYAEGELDVTFKKDLTLHLKDCEQCQRSFAEHRWIHRELHRSAKVDEALMPTDAVFAKLQNKIMAQVEKTSIGSGDIAEVRRIEPSSPFWLRRIAIPMAAAAALVLMIAGSLFTTPSFKGSTNSMAKNNAEDQYMEQTASTNPQVLGNSMMTSQDENEMVLDAAAAKLSRMSDTEARTMLDNLK